MPNTAPMSPSTGDAIIPSCRQSTASFTNLGIDEGGGGRQRMSMRLLRVRSVCWLKRNGSLANASQQHCCLLTPRPSLLSKNLTQVHLFVVCVPAHHAVLDDVFCQRCSRSVALLVRLDERHGFRVELLAPLGSLLSLGIQVEAFAGLAAEESLLHLSCRYGSRIPSLDLAKRGSPLCCISCGVTWCAVCYV